MPRHLLAMSALIMTTLPVSACSSDTLVGPVDEMALTGELADAFATFTSAAFYQVGRGVSYTDILGGRGEAVLQSNAGSVFRWNLQSQAYEKTSEEGPEGGVRFVLYAALEAVRSGAPLIEIGSIDYVVGPNGIQVEIFTEHGDRLYFTFTGTLGFRGAPHSWDIVGGAEQSGASYSFRYSLDAVSADEGTSVRSVSFEGPDNLQVDFASRTSHISVSGAEDSHQELLIRSQHGLAEMIGSTLGGTGEHMLAIDGGQFATVGQLAELWPDFIDYIRPYGRPELSESEVALARQVFRTRNQLSFSLLKVVGPVAEMTF